MGVALVGFPFGPRRWLGQALIPPDAPASAGAPNGPPSPFESPMGVALVGFEPTP